MNWISAIGYTMFPLSEAGTGMKTFSDIMHVYVVTAGVVITSIASLICIMVGGFRTRELHWAAWWAAVAFAMMLVGAIGTNAAPAAYFGLAERFSVFAAVGYNAVLGIGLMCGSYEAWTPEMVD